MSGFFALRRSTFAAGRDFNPVGYKIALEILVKCRCQHVVEIPIHFTDRRLGTSKLSLNEQLRYLKHIWRLYSYKYPAWSHLAQFFVVGLSGAVINLSLLTTFLVWSIATNLAIALSIGLSSAWNFVLYRRFSFSYAKSPSVFWQFAGFAGACSVGAVVNFFATEATWPFFQYKQFAAILGIVAGTTFNFLASRFVVFRQTYIKPPQTETAVANDSKRMSASA